ncbi:PAS-domain containing protein [Rhodobacteraceae bacterium DSL-40]|uniref:PAS-domain containing protein n=1 Tax=Amaricoccus sp. B4 TaxID=3368557 RepID=UPI000DACEF18
MTTDEIQRAIDPVIQAGLDRIDQGITIFNRDLRMVAWNNKFLELLEFPPHLAHLGADFANFVRYNAERGEYGPGIPEEQVAQRVADAWRFEPHCFDRVRPDGTVIRVSGAPLPDRGGFVTLYTDVTAQKEREAALEQRAAERAAALRQSEARLKIIANAVPAGIAHLDEAMVILYANSRFAKAYGHRPEQLVGRRCSDILAEETSRIAAPYFEQARRGVAVDFEMTIMLPDGRRKDIRTFLRPEQPARRGVIGFYILSIDITRQKAANAALLQSHKMDALGRLSSGISHDFNNLLTVIIGNLVPLEERIEDPALRTEFLEPAISAARRGSSLTRRLLALARRQPLAPAPIAVEETIAGIVKLLRSSMPENVEIICSTRGQARAAWADPAQFEMALLNLAINARDAIRGAGEVRFGTEACTIGSVEAETFKIRPGRYVRVRIADTGIGMSREQRDHIFEPFYTSKGDGVGAGLGLTMVYAFVRQSNGAIRVESEPGRGSAFTILLPAADKAARPPELEETAPAPGSTVNAPQPLAMLVEDNPDVRSVLRRQLIALGHPLIEAGNAEDALTLLGHVEGIGLVLSDVGMPGGLSGIELAREIRARAPAVGIVLMTGHGGEIEQEASGGEFPLLRKPFERADLEAAIARARRVAAPARQETGQPA